MEKQVLSIEQMKELKELGIDTSKASMFWYAHCISYSKKGVIPSDYCLYVKGLHKLGNLDNERIIPTFTLQDILSLLPKFINKGNTYFLTLMYDISDGVVISYCTEHIINILHSEGRSNQLDAALSMLKWCKENNFI